jgi:hypothetical protein
MEAEGLGATLGTTLDQFQAGRACSAIGKSVMAVTAASQVAAYGRRIRPEMGACDDHNHQSS